MLEEPIREGVPPKMKGSVLMCVADTEDEVWDRVKRDVYYEHGVWDKEKVSSSEPFGLEELDVWLRCGACLQDWDTLLEVIRFCVRPANRLTCAGPDHPLQERHQTGTLEASIQSCSHESIEDYDSLHPIPISSSGAHSAWDSMTLS